MICKNCGAKYSDDTKFCASCGCLLEDEKGLYNNVENIQNNSSSNNTNSYMAIILLIVSWIGKNIKDHEPKLYKTMNILGTIWAILDIILLVLYLVNVLS